MDFGRGFDSRRLHQANSNLFIHLALNFPKSYSHIFATGGLNCAWVKQ
jgi:hypothetical protein